MTTLDPDAGAARSEQPGASDTTAMTADTSDVLQFLAAFRAGTGDGISAGSGAGPGGAAVSPGGAAVGSGGEEAGDPDDPGRGGRWAAPAGTTEAPPQPGWLTARPAPAAVGDAGAPAVAVGAGAGAGGGPTADAHARWAFQPSGPVRPSWAPAGRAGVATAPLPGESPADAGTGRLAGLRTRLWQEPRGRERVIMAGVLAVTAAVLSFLTVHNDDAAAKWRRLDQAQVRISTTAAQQVQTANTNISKLNSEVKSLNSQISSVQGQLSSVANQKEKALDQTTVFRDLLAAAGEIANSLQGCISSTDQLNSDLATAVASNNPGALAALEQEASAVAGTCARAQQGNDALQAAIQSASSGS